MGRGQEPRVRAALRGRQLRSTSGVSRRARPPQTGFACGTRRAGGLGRQATIPIVIWGATDPVGIGLVQSLARPGGNVTGLSDDQGPEVVGKRLQLLKEVAPRISKVAVLARVPPSATAPRIDSYENAWEAGAQALRLQLRIWALQ